MLYLTADEPATLTLSFLIDTPAGQDYAPADDGTVKYTLRDHAGAPIAGMVDVALATPGSPSEMRVTIPAAHHAKATLIERRTLTYQWASGGQIYSRRLVYYLADWVNLDAEPEAVRAALGVNRAELPDPDISLMTAYFLLKLEIGAAVDTALAAGDVSMVKINRAIVLREALRLLPSLRLKAARAEASGSENFERFDIDWDALREDLAGELEDNLPAEAVTIAHPLLIAAGRPDIFDA